MERIRSYTTAAQAAHEKNCQHCHTLTETLDARHAENAASEARRDRRDLQLGLSKWHRTATLWGIPTEAPRV